MHPTLRALSTTTAATLILLSTASYAQEQSDPPLRVGRVSYVEGTVSFHAGDEDNWSYATLNYPVVAGSAFWTEPNARSEIQVGSVEIRMDHGTEMEVAQLDEQTTRLEVPQGAVNIHFATPPTNGSVEVLTPSGPIELTRPGTYHIDSGQPAADGAPPTPVQVTALEGQLEIRSPRAALEVMPGETAILNGNPPAFSLQEGAPTEFDNWALARERREEAHQSAQYVSPHVTGYEDLDNYGQWNQNPTYGSVWYPTAVDAGWAPYREGHWAFVAPWGWTWVDNAPWGFAPFHYGRWAYVDNRWGWVPGEVVPHPCYAPALVAFVGGAGWNVSIGIGGGSPAVGWVPLGPREVFHPYYQTSVNYARSVNISNVDRREVNNITINNYHTNTTINNYANQRYATVVPSNSFQHGQQVHQSMVKVSPEQLSHAQVTPTLSHLAPSEEARASGRTLPASVKAQIPHENVEQRMGHEPGNIEGINHQAPAPHTGGQPQENRPETHLQQNAVQHENAAPEQHNVPTPHANAAPQAEARHEEQRHEETRPQGAAAPGPNFRRPATPEEQQQHLARFTPPKPEHEPLPKAEVPHPQQHAPLAPTPQGWQRVPQQQHVQQPHPQQEQHPAQQNDERHPQEQH